APLPIMRAGRPRKYVRLWFVRSSARRGRGRGRCPRVRRRAARGRADRAGAPTACAAKLLDLRVWIFLRCAACSYAPSKLGACRVAMACDQMVVDHADCLHEGIDDGRPDEFE